MTIAAAASSAWKGIGAFTLAALLGCGPVYGASFGYPDAPAVPDTAKVVASDKGQDDDSPIRLRVKVIEVDKSSVGALLDFYRATYESADGWTQLRVDRSYQMLCLVRHASNGFSEFVEVFPQAGSPVTGTRGRYLVSISRIELLESGGDKNTCGLSQGWVPSALL